MPKYHCCAATQARCRTILTRFTDAFLGPLRLEDDEPYKVRAIFLHGDKLRLDVFSMRSLFRAYTILYRTLKLDSWHCDYTGELGVGEARHYQVGVRLIHADELQLGVFFRPRHLHNAARTGNPKLEVVV